MTLLDDAKLLTTANSSKVGTLYSIKPDNGAGDLDITRSTTATRVNPSGIIESVAINEPQLDYTDGCGCLWVEPISTNLVKMSENLDDVLYWTRGSGLAVTGDTTVSPDGNTNADTIVGDPDGSLNQMYFIGGVTVGFTLSFYAKRGTMTDMKYSIYDHTNSVDIIAPTSYYSQTSSSEWSRITVTFTNSATTNHIKFYPIIDNTGSTSAGETCFIWGVQLEKHSGDLNMESSYIPTTSASVTRNASSYIKTGLSSVIGSSEGVYFSEIAYFYNGSTVTSSQSLLGINDSNNSAIYQLGKWGTSFIGFTRNTAGSTILFSMSPAITSGSFSKLAVKYKAGDHAYWVNGVEIATSTEATAIPATQDRVVASYQGISSFWAFYGKIRSIQVYDTALTDPQLLALTT